MDWQTFFCAAAFCACAKKPMIEVVQKSCFSTLITIMSPLCIFMRHLFFSNPFGSRSMAAADTVNASVYAPLMGKKKKEGFFLPAWILCLLFLWAWKSGFLFASFNPFFGVSLSVFYSFVCVTCVHAWMSWPILSLSLPLSLALSRPTPLSLTLSFSLFKV